ncbi:FG-GAP repeat domain-containing protein [Streptomyces sp. XH2]|uniref:FG-GAP repeat domain-containing protein n=1 Tax=Streptomyces sp. XH2 TaxID=3412483 RepID=UPI003C7B1659
METSPFRRLGALVAAGLTALALAVATTSTPAGAVGNTTDVLWHNTTSGEVGTWLLDSNRNVIANPSLSWRCGPECNRDWKLSGTGDFNGDGKTDLLWHNTTTGEVGTWLLDGNRNVIANPPLSWRCGPECNRDWKLSGTGDFNGDGKTDLLWHNTTTGEVGTWLLDGNRNVIANPPLSWRCGPECNRDWKLSGTGDFNGDGKTDLLWHNTTTGEVGTWLLDGRLNVTANPPLSWRCGPECNRDWKLSGTGDFNGDGKTDLLWHNTTTGEVGTWLLDGRLNVTANPPLSWRCGPECNRDWKLSGTGRFG